MKLFDTLKSDLSASVVVFFVALPLCLGIALASGAPLFSGIIAGIVGGIVVGVASGSALGVSGPAAGLAIIVLTAIGSLGSYESFLVAVVIGGILQLLMGYLKAGFIAYFFPSSVIKGMLSGIGLLIILKQIPHAFGFDNEYEGSLAFELIDGHNTFTELLAAWDLLTPGAVLIAAISMLLLVLWDQFLMKKHVIFQIIQGPVVVVLLGILMYVLYQDGVLPYALDRDQMVNLPVAHSFSDFVSFFTFPDFSQLANFEIYKLGVVIAIVASLETLLCVEATDKLDPHKRVTPTNRELKAQGVGNVVSGMIGGLPVTQVIVRSSANIAFGAKSKLSAIVHGVFLLLSALTIAQYLNMIPLASLASILIIVGYKLAKPELFIEMYKKGWGQLIPFLVTIIAILTTDLLKGISLGLLVGLFFTLYHRYHLTYEIDTSARDADGRKVHRLVLSDQVSFFSKAGLIDALEKIPEHAKVQIDCTQCKVMDYDVQEVINNYQTHAELKGIDVQVLGLESVHKH